DDSRNVFKGEQDANALQATSPCSASRAHRLSTKLGMTARSGTKQRAICTGYGSTAPKRIF
ncbi:hypothetical protein ACKXGD_17210, partial [Enterococcus lactis]|uniref:hypothetical protein n=1 Tax=Enterococcus lactis TaxID=357441 RepID=UPI00390813C1